MTELEEPLLTGLLNRYAYPEAQRDEQKASEASERFKAPLRVLDGALAGRSYLAGDAFTVADLNVAAVLTWASLAKFDLTPAPSVQAWFARCTARPAFARAVQMR